jgi:hypothetical protein|tara:strand:+ start:66 stop:977 length:912 start_codon:yes stop_codon:yes gene_type:complete
MKNLDTLVTDIYSKLSVLGEGKQLDVSEEVIEELGESIKTALKNWAHPEPRDSNQTLRMSNIGRPTRQLWYDLNSKESNTPISPSTFIKFLYGHILEEVVLFLVRLAGHKVDNEQRKVSVNGIKGHMDCTIDGEVVDVKTASGYAFKKFRDGTLAEQDIFGYMSQLAGYEEAMGTEGGGFLALNKETGELALFRPEELDKPNIKTKISKVKKALKSSTPPEKCYDTVPDGMSGNMKLPRECFYCRHKYECHQDTNDGKGLRIFQYAKGLAYFTTVVKEPKVQEITNELKKNKTNKQTRKSITI